MVHKAIRIQISPKDPVARNIEHSVAFIEMDDKRFFLERLVNENLNSKVLVFVRTKVRAERVRKAMERVNIQSLSIHSDKKQQERNKVMQQFHNGTIKVLIATDVSARGIDIPNVDYVINYDLPEQAENYVHRVGRTGRGKKKGLAVSFCSKGEKELLKKIQVYLGKPIQKMEVNKIDVEETRDLSSAVTVDLNALMKEIEDREKKRKKWK